MPFKRIDTAPGRLKSTPRGADIRGMQIFISRQPIFDQHDGIAGYELLYGGAPADAELDGIPQTPEQLVLDAFVGVGIDQLTGGRPAFVSATRDMLIRRSIELLDPQGLIVQVGAAEQRDDELVASCRKLRSAGYRLALDGIPRTGAIDPLLPCAQFLKVSIPGRPSGTLTAATRRLAQMGVRVIAKNVANRTSRDLCVDAGVELFEGFLFSRPETIAKRDLPIEHIRTFQLMKMVRDVSVADTKIEEEMRGDISLTYKLLRIVNSAAVGARGVRSIGHAMRILGRQALYKWLAFLLVSAAVETGVEEEIMTTALVRARFCELLADAGSRPLDPGSLYIVGLLSLMDTLLGAPMEDLVAQMDLATEVAAALVARRGPFGQVLGLAESYEGGYWKDVETFADEIGVTADEVGSLYLASLRWARERTSDL